MLLPLAFAFSSLLAGQPVSSQDSLEKIPPRAREELKKFNRGEGTLRPGDMAVDFDLKSLGSNARVSLSSFRNKKAVALVFGSYT